MCGAQRMKQREVSDSRSRGWAHARVQLVYGHPQSDVAARESKNSSSQTQMLSLTRADGMRTQLHSIQLVLGDLAQRARVVAQLLQRLTFFVAEACNRPLFFFAL